MIALTQLKRDLSTAVFAFELIRTSVILYAYLFSCFDLSRLRAKLLFVDDVDELDEGGINVDSLLCASLEV